MTSTYKGPDGTIHTWPEARTPRSSPIQERTAPLGHGAAPKPQRQDMGIQETAPEPLPTVTGTPGQLVAYAGHLVGKSRVEDGLIEFASTDAGREAATLVRDGLLTGVDEDGELTP